MGAFGQQLGIEKFKDAVESGVRKGIADEETKSQTAEAPTGTSSSGGAKLSSFIKTDKKALFANELDGGQDSLQRGLFLANEIVLGPKKRKQLNEFGSSGAPLGRSNTAGESDTNSTGDKPAGGGSGGGGGAGGSEHRQFARDSLSWGFNVSYEKANYANAAVLRQQLINTKYKRDCMAYFRDPKGAAAVLGSSLFLGMFLYSHPALGAAFRPIQSGQAIAALWRESKSLKGFLGNCLKRAGINILAIDSGKAAFSQLANAGSTLFRMYELMTAGRTLGAAGPFELSKNFAKHMGMTFWKAKNTLLTIFVLAGVVYHLTKRDEDEGIRQLSDLDEDWWDWTRDVTNQGAMYVVANVEAWEAYVTGYLQDLGGIPADCQTTGAWAIQMCVGAALIGGTRGMANLAGWGAGKTVMSTDELASMAAELEAHRLLSLRNEIATELTSAASSRVAGRFGSRERLINENDIDDFLRVAFQIEDPRQKVDAVIDIMKRSKGAKNIEQKFAVGTKEGREGFEAALRKEAEELLTECNGKMEKAVEKNQDLILSQTKAGQQKIDQLENITDQRVRAAQEQIFERIRNFRRAMDPASAGKAEEFTVTARKQAQTRNALEASTEASTPSLFPSHLGQRVDMSAEAIARRVNAGEQSGPNVLAIRSSDELAKGAEDIPKGELAIYNAELAVQQTGRQANQATETLANVANLDPKEFADAARAAAQLRNDRLDSLLNYAKIAGDNGGLSTGVFLRELDNIAVEMSEALMELTRKGGFEISLRQADNIIDFYSVVLKADETIEQWMSLIHKKNAYVKVDGKWTLGGKPIDKDNPFVDYVLGGTRKGRGVEAQFDLDDVVDGVKKSVTELADDGPLVLNPKFDEILKEAANKVRSAYNKVDPLSFSGGLNSRFTVYQWMLITTGTAAIIYAIHKYWSSKRTKKVSDFYEDIQRKDNSQAIADALALHSAEFDYEKEEADGMLENIVELFNPDPDRSEGRIVLATLYDKYIFVRPVDIIANKVVDEWEKYVSTTSLQAAEGLDRNKVKNFGFKLRNMLLDLKCGQLVNDVVGDRLPKKIGKGEEEARPKGQHFKWDKYFSKENRQSLKSQFLEAPRMSGSKVVQRAPMTGKDIDKMSPEEKEELQMKQKTWWPLLVRILIFNADIPNRFTRFVANDRYVGLQRRPADGINISYIDLIRARRSSEYEDMVIRILYKMEQDEEITDTLRQQAKAELKADYTQKRNRFMRVLWNNYIFIYNNGNRKSITNAAGEEIMPGSECTEFDGKDNVRFCAPFPVDKPNTVQINKNLDNFYKTFKESKDKYMEDREKKSPENDLGEKFFNSFKTYKNKNIPGKAKELLNKLPFTGPMEEQTIMKNILGRTELENLVSEVLKEQYSSGYSEYPYSSHRGDEEEPTEDYIEDWKSLELEIIQDKTRNSAIQLAKILINDLELFNDVLDLTGQNQSVGSEILRKLDQTNNKIKKS